MNTGSLVKKKSNVTFENIGKDDSVIMNNSYTKTFSVDVEDFYSIVNSLRDSCGCPDCQRIARDLLDQNREQIRADQKIGNMR